jgi:hypothetical protein
MHLSAQRAEQPLLRVTLRVLDVPATFDDAQLLRPSGLLDSGEVKILAAPYVVVASGAEGALRIVGLPEIPAWGAAVLGHQALALIVKPVLEPGTAHVRYTMDVLLAGPEQPIRHPVRSDSLMLGELQLIESHGFPDGHRRLALISAEMEVMKVDSSGKTMPTGKISFASNPSFGPVVERTLSLGGGAGPTLWLNLDSAQVESMTAGWYATHHSSIAAAASVGPLLNVMQDGPTLFTSTVGGVFLSSLGNELWDTDSPVGAETISGMISQSVALRGSSKVDMWVISDATKLPQTFMFRTPKKQPACCKSLISPRTRAA